MTTKTQQALNWLDEDETRTAYAAAQLFGLTQGAISRGKKIRDERGCCPTCGQVNPSSTKRGGPKKQTV